MAPESRSEGPFDADDLAQLRNRGLSTEAVERQISLLRTPPPPIELVAACTPGDGVQILEEDKLPELLGHWQRAAAAGRLTKIVPASGAASRMFASLVRILNNPLADDPGRLAEAAKEGDQDAKDGLLFAQRLPDFAFYDDLAAAAERSGESLADLRSAGHLSAILRLLMNSQGLGYGRKPKGLVPFHRERGHAASAADEHFAEALELVKDSVGSCRLHFSVPSGSEDAFRRAAAKTQAQGADFEIAFSNQSPATDTLALADNGAPFRTADGSLLFRPGGHGSLLDNLERAGADIALVKNIDNVQPAELRSPAILWQRALVGLLVQLQEQIHSLLGQLTKGEEAALGEARSLVSGFLERSVPEPPGDRHLTAEALVERLDRPLRVCGVVVLDTDSGGGPFWVRDRAHRVTRQIVESAEIGATKKQRSIVGESTHFNPVLMALGLRDWRDEPFRLESFVDRDRVFVTEKNWEGRSLRALEHPGLWNGSMADWNTVFVEVPAAAFTPVKTVFDLLRPEHQPRES